MMMKKVPPLAMVESLVSKPVQEVVANSSNQVPERYIYKGEDGAIDASFPLLEVSVIDILRLLNSSSDDDELLKLRSALASCGCFQAINHGMESSFLDKVREIAKQFFLLPIEGKHKYSRTVEDLEGYGNDSVLSEHQILDWTDREILHDYTTKLAMLNELVLKSMAKSLNLEENCFLNQYGERATMFARFNFYPPCPKPDRTLGLKPHADGSAITFLLQDKEIMSNGMFKSPVHRVVTNSERERITLAVFCMPESNNEIEPVEGLIDEKRPRLYKSMKDYGNIYFQNYQLGKRPIDAAKL
ncbi:hypothetical protein TEA_021303 [Camellia sinensis var. sinensis]|uniref:Fe2OG dioxygenase domain-containing protein n=1 Tax=Camellia sinensis var. sinensis TaxID=542762 RepID=A0A4S4DXK9_CAMSN|nr:hypothetical protein TEA_021303 [Camellia sinensis var. sinensis]